MFTSGFSVVGIGLIMLDVQAQLAKRPKLTLKSVPVYLAVIRLSKRNVESCQERAYFASCGWELSESGA